MSGSIPLYHFIETASSNFIWGFVIGWGAWETRRVIEEGSSTSLRVSEKGMVMGIWLGSRGEGICKTTSWQELSVFYKQEYNLYMNPSAHRVKTWKKWFRFVHNQIFHLYEAMQIYEELKAIVVNSPYAKSTSVLWGYLFDSFAIDIILRISRLCEKQARNNKGKIIKKREIISLRSLLEEFEEYNSYFSRSRILRVGKSLSNRKKDVKKGQNERFDSLVGKRHIVLPKTHIRKDIKALEITFAKTKKFRDKFVAHESKKRKIHKPLKLEELDNCRQLLTKLADKYSLLIDNSVSGFHSRPDISEMFKKPWIGSIKNLEIISDRFHKIYHKYEEG